jgi:ABC-type uncharacterized transport system YnjBCD ATPase subunit
MPRRLLAARCLLTWSTALIRITGSGKSTLLNTLALRLDRAVTFTGDLKLNGRDYDIAELKLTRYTAVSST